MRWQAFSDQELKELLAGLHSSDQESQSMEEEVLRRLLRELCAELVRRGYLEYA